MSCEKKAADAIEELAELLFFKMEHLDPTDDPSKFTWESLDDHDQDFYRICVEWLLHREDLVLSALGQIPRP